MKADCCALRAPAIRDGIRTPAYRPSSSFRPLLPSPHRLAMKADCCALRAPAIRDGIRTPAYRPSSSFRPLLPSPHRLAMKADCCALRAPAIRDGIRTPAYRPSSSFRPRLPNVRTLWRASPPKSSAAWQHFHRKKKQFRRFSFHVRTAILFLLHTFSYRS